MVKQEGIIVSLLLILTVVISLKLNLKKNIFFFGFISLVTLHIFLEIYFKGTYGFHEPIHTNLIERLINLKKLYLKLFILLNI